MAKVKKIILNNFRNFQNIDFYFQNKVNIFFGNNGTGKTNILESISLLSKGRGFRNANITNLIKNNSKNFLIKSILEINKNKHDIKISTAKNNEKLKKIIEINNNSLKEDINFLNNSISFLVFLPEMERLFQLTPSYRRNFIDRLIYSEKNDYNKLVNTYKKKISERTKILQSNNIDRNWIDIIENDISVLGLEIYKLRNFKLDILNNHILKINKFNDYKFNINLEILDSFFNLNLTKDIYKDRLKDARELDKKIGGSIIGPHKSDIKAKVNDNFSASHLSTGQQKTIVLILLLAQCDYLINIKKINPILLLDEICSHLDSINRKILLDIINNFDIQFFLTGTDKSLFSFISTNVGFYNIT